ncbi:GNAT superfamily N-acetyltransferase [Kibdelosporangium banguiense]|uniref:GNAT superfamily N-acetyltransferase n=1 Tax=Kibdelosporangium banguiense TaxID=1365924 RepID=A0ABS4T6Y9_9PSEU|nr:GNAT family N-acetyltransferase [Kibdelosporangium banguiense]MBP2319646.1 GNAT superfamily N-acetyltransferase [Kibdelosporangium banguiense]
MSINRLGADRLADCLALAESREWLRQEHLWRLLFEIGDVYGIDDADGGLAGVVVSTQYGNEVAAIGMMLVAPSYARQGLGTRLMTHALQAAGTASAWLVATEYGRPVYERLAFRAVGEKSQFIGDFGTSASGVSRPASTEDMPEIARLDAEIFGMSRPKVLAQLPTFCTSLRVIDGPAGLRGYAGSWPNVGNTVIGPVLAENPQLAQALIEDLAAEIDGPIRLDLTLEQQGLVDWVESLGVQRGATTTVMVRGEPLPGDRKRLFTGLTSASG